MQPITTAERDRICSEALNTYLFDHVWNEPVSEYRVNIRPMLLKERSVIGTLALADTTLVLPTVNTAYYVWAINAADFNTGLKLPTNEWVDGVTVSSTYRTLIHFYGINGAIFHKAFVYFRYSCHRDTIFIAAEKAMVTKCIPANSVDNVFLTVYYDSDLTNEIQVLSICPETIRRLPAHQLSIDNFLAQVDNPDQLQIYHNGVEITDVNNPPVPEVGEYYDLILDRNIIFAFDVDITSVSDNPVYFSDQDSCWKQLVHIPKALNPENKLLTHNTCDFFVRRAMVDDVHGYYLHRASERSITQVTHNDFGIPLFIMDAYRDYLETQLVNLHIVVRQHEKDNVLVRDASFIDLLYCDKHTDADIIRILTGNGPAEIPWWKAANLEASPYVKMMFDTPNLNHIEHMPEYVAALGFYQVIQILCRRVCDTILTEDQPTGITYRLPVLYSGYDVIPVVYRNGKALTRDQYSYVTNDNNTLDVAFHVSDVHWKGDRITTIFFINGNNEVKFFIPTDMGLSLQVPYSDVEVYEIITASGDTTPQGVNSSSQIAYRHVTPGSNQYATVDNGDGTCTVLFNATLTGTQFLIFNKYCTYHHTYNLAEYTATGKSIAIPATTLADDGQAYPILNFQNVCVWLNGDYLVNGVDYSINTVTDTDGNVALREIVVQTMDHFNEAGDDQLEVLFNIAEIEDLSSGFVIDNKLQDQTPINLYFPRLSVAHVDGTLERDAVYEGLYLSVPEGKYAQGDIFEIQTSIPQFVKDYVLKWTENQDLERIKIMNDYFYTLDPINKDVLVLEDKHRIYSIYMNNILWDIAHNEGSLVDDPDHDRFLGQLTHYEYLKDIDLCNAGLDQRFMDYYPQYVNYEVDAATKNLFDRIIKELMPVNEDPTQEVVYE